MRAIPRNLRPLGRVALTATVVAPLLLAPLLASAQRRGPLLHEPIPDDPEDDRRMRVASGLSGFAQSANGLVPETRDADGKASDPRLSGFDRPFVPDRDTRAPDILAGTNVFEPSISPYERIAAFDAVLPDFTVGVADANVKTLARAPVPQGYDLFRARFEVSLPQQRAFRVPTAIAGSLLVDSQVTMGDRAIGHRLVADGADNWFLVASDAGRAIVRLTIASPRAAFGGPFGSPEWSALPRVRELPEGPKRSAAVVLERLGLSRKDPPARAVERMTQYFREFKDSKEPPEPQGDVYRDIALSKKGVCRHRAYAFLVTATALGLPTRLVMNGEHAWVEVHNGVLFKRIDLGGGGTIMNPERSDVTPYREPQDPFSWPAGAVSGRDSAQRGRSGTTGGPTTLPAASGSAEAAASVRAVPSNVPSDPPDDTVGPRARITFSASQKDVLRGSALDVSGDVRAGDHSCGFVGVDLSLVPTATGGPARAVPIGSLPSDADGRFRGTVRVPGSISLGDYRVVAKTRGGKGCGPGGSP